MKQTKNIRGALRITREYAQWLFIQNFNEKYNIRFATRYKCSNCKRWITPWQINLHTLRCGYCDKPFYKKECDSK